MHSLGLTPDSSMDWVGYNTIRLVIIIVSADFFDARTYLSYVDYDWQVPSGVILLIQHDDYSRSGHPSLPTSLPSLSVSRESPFCRFSSFRHGLRYDRKQ